MSVWGEIRKRGLGKEIKKEDVVEEENSWESKWEWNTNWNLKPEIERLKKEQVKLSTSISDLRRELDKFKWKKTKNYVKCNYKI